MASISPARDVFSKYFLLGRGALVSAVFFYLEKDDGWVVGVWEKNFRNKFALYVFHILFLGPEYNSFSNHRLYKLVDVQAVIGPNMPKAQTS